MTQPTQLQQLSKQFDEFLRAHHGVSLPQVLDAVKETSSELMIPIEIFHTKLSVLESVTKFLREAEDLPFSRIGHLLNRHPASLTTSYKKTLTKYSDRFSPSFRVHSSFLLPVSLFTDRELSPLEAVTSYLYQKKKLRLCQIARYLRLDQRTIWTAVHRSKTKKGAVA